MPLADKITIARELGISRPTLDGYLNQPDAPQPNKARKYDLRAVSEYIADHTTSERTGAKVSGDIKNLKALELKLKCERLKLKLDEERGLYWSRSEVSATVQQIAQTQRSVLQRKLETELPPKLLGLGVVDITELMRQTVDDICRILNDRTQKFTTQTTP